MRPTIENAKKEEASSSRKGQFSFLIRLWLSRSLMKICPLRLLIARVTSYALNIAIGLQVLISALITGLSAVAKNVRHY